METREQAHNAIIKLFPKLIKDSTFQVTSKKNTNYNCIAWASLYDNIWIWPILDPPYYQLDGVRVDWPEDIPVNEELETFILYFNRQNYINETLNYQFEEGFQKIAIFVDLNGQVTHAARQKGVDGKWTSKLGEIWDIEHASPYDLEGNRYGQIAKILIRPFSQ